MEKQLEGRSGKTSRPLKAFGDVVFALILLLTAIMVFSLVYAKATGGPPLVAGHHMYIVLSGSMNPAFDTGSLVLVRPIAPEKIKIGDIITYRGFGDQESLVSHRVVSVLHSDDGISFITKGDANDVEDVNPVPPKNLVGKVVLAIPYVGYFLEFTKTKRGLFTIVMIPAALLIVVESANLYKYLKELKGEKGLGSSQEDIDLDQR